MASKKIGDIRVKKIGEYGLEVRDAFTNEKMFKLKDVRMLK